MSQQLLCRRWWFCAAMLAGTVRAACAAAPAAGEWLFTATLNGTPMGQHRFAVTVSGEERRVTSEADFAYKLLGLVVYRYHHEAVEQWRGDCLAGLTATTNDDGKIHNVQVATRADGLVVNAAPAAPQPLAGCVMTFAYWNPAIRTQTQLLNAQTGKLEQVQISQAGSAPIDVRGQSVTATRWRIATLGTSIDMWYSAQGDWIGLDSTVAGGRQLSYRLK